MRRPAAAPARAGDDGRAARRPGADRGRARRHRAGAALEPDDAVEAALQADIDAARSPAAAARALDHKLGGPREHRRYTAPSYELRHGDALAVVPGFNPVEAYETAIANLAPELPRRARPESVEELLAWAEEPLATAEIAAVMQRSMAPLRAELARVAEPIPAGADVYWRGG